MNTIVRKILMISAFGAFSLNPVCGMDTFENVREIVPVVQNPLSRYIYWNGRLAFEESMTPRDAHCFYLDIIKGRSAINFEQRKRLPSNEFRNAFAFLYQSDLVGAPKTSFRPKSVRNGHLRTWLWVSEEAYAFYLELRRAENARREARQAQIAQQEILENPEIVQDLREGREDQRQEVGELENQEDLGLVDDGTEIFAVNDLVQRGFLPSLSNMYTTVLGFLNQHKARILTAFVNAGERFLTLLILHNDGWVEPLVIATGGEIIAQVAQSSLKSELAGALARGTVFLGSMYYRITTVLGLKFASPETFFSFIDIIRAKGGLLNMIRGFWQEINNLRTELFSCGVQNEELIQKLVNLATEAQQCHTDAERCNGALHDANVLFQEGLLQLEQARSAHRCGIM